VVIVNLVAPATREGRVLKTLLDKLEKIRKQLRSDKVFDSIGRLFQGVSIKDYMARALIDGTDEITAQLDGQLTKEQVKALEDRERHLYGDGGDVKRELPRLRESIERETFFRLLPGYVRQFVAAAAPQMGMDIEGDLDGQFSLLPGRKGAVDALLETLDTYPPDQARRLSVQRPEDRRSCIWMHPGEPVFERFREMARAALGHAALRGAVFVDPTADKPYLFHVACLSVVRQSDPDVDELAHEEMVDCRLVGVRQGEGIDTRLCPVEHLLLLRGGCGLPPAAQRLAVTGISQRELVHAYLTERVCRTMAVEHRTRLLEALPERETFVIRGCDFQEAELAAARAKLAPRARTGNAGAAAELSRIKTQQRELSARRERTLAVIRREPELLVPGDVRFIAHALVVPSTEAADRERLDANIEQIAMEHIKASETACGATIRFVHTPALARAAGLPENPGFDILSIRPNGERRCIEAKGRAGTGEIEVTDNEWARACNLREKYWLYVVYHCATPTPQVVRVQDPFSKLLVRPFTRTQAVERTISAIVRSGGVRIGQAQVVEAGEV